MFRIKLFCTIIITFLISTNVHSQYATGGSGSAYQHVGGGYSDGGNPHTSKGDYYNHMNRKKKVDVAYELGKSIFKGKKEGAPKINYCVAEDQDKTKLKRKSIKKFKKTTYTELAQNLYDCDKPDELVSQSLSEHQLTHVIYYLDKRYRLKLSED